ncbi:PAS domain S-box protein [Paraflavisolibacter sp. H34]|uniref:PAS domain S-box protein n=1 Tax=Huijunlia imazamoxiresistens TaxID=3127457 RepID=UPI003019371E
MTPKAPLSYRPGEKGALPLPHLLLQVPLPAFLLQEKNFLVDQANEQAQGLWGWSAEELRHRSFPDLFDSAFHRDVQEALEQVRQSGTAVEVPEVLLLSAAAGGGPERSLTLKIGPVTDAQGHLTALVAVCLDVTGEVTVRRIAEETEQGLKEQFQHTFENAAVGIAHVAPDGSWLLVNNRLCSIIGYSPEELRELTFQDITHPDDIEADLAYARQLLSGKLKSYSMEKRYFHKDGSWVWVSLVVSLVRDSEGQPQYFISVVKDISKRKKAEEALKESEERFRSLADDAPMWVWMADTRAQVFYVNKEELRYLGLSQVGELGNLHWEQYVHPDDVDRIYQTYSEAVRTQSPYTLECRHRNRQTGGYEWFLFKGVPRFEHGTFAGYIGTAINIHAQKLLTEQLEHLVEERTQELQRSNDDLQQFAHVVSHDLKEPVRKIRTFSSRAASEMGGALPDKVKQYLEKMDQAASRMYSLIEGVLTYASAGATAIDLVPVPLTEIIRGVETDLEMVLQQKEGVLTCEDLPVVEGAPVLLHQLFYNLINNSLKFSREGVPPRISVSYERVKGDRLPHPLPGANRDYVLIRLQDNGIGFRNEEVDQIFKPFGRLHAKTKYEGTGLGLALCKKIAERHGGALLAEGKEGEGATFTVILPAASPPSPLHMERGRG